MNTLFNINRLSLLLKRFFIEEKQRELTFWGISTFVFLIMHITGSNEKSSAVIIFLFISGFIFAARTFKIFNQTPGGMHYLLIPATHLEKLITAILLNTFYFFVMMVGTYLIGTTLGITLGNLLWETNNPIQFGLFQSTMNFSEFNQPTLSLLDTFITFAGIQSVFMLGSIYFKGNSVGKTMLVIIAVSLAFALIELFLMKATFGSFSVNSQTFSLSINSPEDLFPGLEIIGKTIKYSLIPFFWIVSYFRLTEKQV